MTTNLTAHSSIDDSKARSVPTHPAELDFLWLEITQHCNLRCRHCYTMSSPTRSHNDIDWNALVDQAHSTGCRKVQFIGGEPLSHPRILEYVRHARELQFEFIEVFSNLCLLTAEACAVFAQCDVHLATSFYSTRAGMHDALTGTPGSFLDTLEGIKRALQWNLPLRVGLIITDAEDENVHDKLEFLGKLGISRHRIRIDHVRPVGRGAKMTPFESVQNTLCGACGDGKLAISYDGKCYPCVFSRHLMVGNVATDRITEVLESEALQEFRQTMQRQIRASCNPDETPGPGGPPPCNPTFCLPDCSPACNPICTPTPPCGPKIG